MVNTFNQQIITSPRKLKFEIQQYPVPGIDFSAVVNQTVLTRIDDSLTRLAAARSAYATVLSNPEQFFNPDRQKAMQRIDSINVAINTLLDARELAIAGKPDQAPAIDEALFAVPDRWRPYRFDVMLATRTPYLLTEIYPSDSDLGYRVRGRFTLVDGNLAVAKGPDAPELKFYLTSYNAGVAVDQRLTAPQGSLSDAAEGTLFVKVIDDPGIDDNRTDGGDPIRIELARAVIY
jgi:hypothetical protein